MQVKSINSLKKNLINVMMEGQTVIVWSLRMGHLTRLRATIRTIKSDRNQIHLSLIDHQKHLLESLMGGDFLINFMAPSESLIFSSEVVKIDSEDMIISFPQTMVKYDRRKSERFKPLIDLELEIHSGGKSVRRDCFDLSEEGLGFLAMKNELKGFKEGDIIEKAFLIHGKTRIQVDLKLMRISKLAPFQISDSPYAASLLGFSFHGDNQISRHMVQKIILGHQALVDDLS